MKFVRRRSSSPLLPLVNSVEGGEDVSYGQALREIERFCEGLGGELVTSIDIGLAKPGEKLNVVQCIVPRRLSNVRLAEAIAEIRNRLSKYLRRVMSDLGEFEIEEEGAPRRRTIYSLFSDNVRVSEEMARRFDIDPSSVEYAYPDFVEDYSEDSVACISVRGSGSRHMLKKGVVEAWAYGYLQFKAVPDEKTIERKLDELDEMLEDILSDPRNFFKLRS